MTTTGQTSFVTDAEVENTAMLLNGVRLTPEKHDGINCLRLDAALITGLQEYGRRSNATRAALLDCEKEIRRCREFGNVHMVNDALDAFAALAAEIRGK